MQRIGKYEILEHIGAGGFGIVFKGRDPLIERLVAVKTCNSDDEELRHRFVREARTAGRLQHRNITTVYDFGYHEGVPYLVQEYLTGEDLDRILKRGDRPLPVTRLSWLEQIARGLNYAHANGIVHRDVKPSNIRILEDGTAKIMDFGIAKLLENDSGLTRAGATVGTAAYLAPEQLHGEPVDARTDLFAFGVLAYELLTGRRPFAGKQLSAVIYQILHHDPEPIRQLAPECPQAVATLVAACLEKDRTRRPASADEVADLLAAQISELLSESAIARVPTLRPPVAAVRVPEPAAPVQSETTRLGVTSRRLPESTAGLRELALDPDAGPASDSFSGTRALEVRGAPWGTVLAVAAALLVAGLGVAGIVQMVSGSSDVGISSENSTPTNTTPGTLDPPSATPANPTDPPAAAPLDGPPAGTPGTQVATPDTNTVSPPRDPPPAPKPAVLTLSASWASNVTVEVAGRRLILDRAHELELPAGDYRLDFELTTPYASRASIPVSLAAGDRRAISAPFRRPGLLTLQPQLGAPQGSVSVDGNPARVGVIRGLVLAPGRHRVRIDPLAGNGPTLSYDAEVESGRELILTFDLARQLITPVVKPIAND